MALRHSLTTAAESLPKETFQLSHKIYGFASFNKCVPFQLVGKEDMRVKRFGSIWRLILWHCANWTFIFSFIFQWSSYIHEAATKPFGQDQAIHLAVVTALSFNFIFMVTMYLKSEEGIFLVNQQEFMSRSLKESKPTSKQGLLLAKRWF